MALICLLIETFLQFYKGTDETPKNNRDEYSDFLCHHFPNVFVSKRMAKNFYSKIRCGILHSAQTKNDAILTYNKAYPAQIINGVLMVSIDKFSDMLKGYFNDYIENLRSGNNLPLRKNFIKKMNFICNK